MRPLVTRSSKSAGVPRGDVPFPLPNGRLPSPDVASGHRLLASLDLVKCGFAALDDARKTATKAGKRPDNVDFDKALAPCIIEDHFIDRQLDAKDNLIGALRNIKKALNAAGASYEANAARPDHGRPRQPEQAVGL